MTKSTTVKSYREEPVPKLCRIQFQLIKGGGYMAKWSVIEIKMTDKTARSKYIHGGSGTMVTKKTQNFYYNQGNANSFYAHPDIAMQKFIEAVEKTKADPGDWSPNSLACLDSAVKELQKTLPKIQQYFYHLIHSHNMSLRKYGIFPQVSGVVIGKLNKANTAFLDKEELSDGQVLNILSNLIKYLKPSYDGDIKVSSGGVEEFTIVFPKKPE